MDIINIANSWIGTKFHYTGRIKKNNYNKGGVDCIGLIIEVGKECGSKINGKSLKYYDYLTYSQYPNCGEMQQFLNKYFLKINKDELQSGDLIYFNFNNKLEHIAIYDKERNAIIHCSASAKKVFCESITDYWEEKIIGYYRYIL